VPVSGDSVPVSQVIECFAHVPYSRLERRESRAEVAIACPNWDLYAATWDSCGIEIGVLGRVHTSEALLVECSHRAERSSDREMAAGAL
jgi:hypothetical protein